MSRVIVKATSPYEDKKLAIFEMVNSTSVNICTENGLETISPEQFKSIRKLPRTSKYLLVRKDTKDKELKGKNLQEQYDIVVKESKALFELTKGEMNRFRTGSVSQTALQLYYDICKPPVPDPILPFESKIIESCYNAALMWAIPYTGYGYKYDVCSQYPAILRSTHMSWPIGEGQLSTIKQSDVKDMKFFKYGIYHVKILNPDYRLFRTSQSNWYTHICLTRAILELKYEFEVIEDGEPNLLTFTKFINGAKLFGPFIDYLFPFKKDGHKYVKKYINVLAGALCKTNIISVNVDDTNSIIYKDRSIMAQMPLGRDLDDMYSTKTCIDIVRIDKLYENDYARIKSFLVSRARANISKIIEKNLENVIHVHTDGIIMKKPIHKDQVLGSDIGDLKFESEGDVFVKNCTNFKIIEKSYRETLIECSSFKEFANTMNTKL